MAKKEAVKFTHKLKIKKGDRVVVIAGTSKSRTTVREVLEVFPDKNRAIVEGVNIAKKHTKATQEAQGGIIDKPMSIHISNLMVVDKTGAPTRVGRQLVDGKLQRYSKKSGEIFSK